MGMIETASRLIAKWGQAGVITRTSGADESVYPPIPGIATDYPATMAVVDYRIEDRDGTNIAVGDLRALVSVEGLDIAPDNGDRLTVAGEAYSVVRVSPLAPDGSARFHDLQLRRT